MKKITITFFFLFVLSTKAQCPYPIANTQIGATITFCVGDPNSVVNVNTTATGYILANVVQGFTYNFSVADVYAGNSENLNVYNAATNTSLVFASGPTGASISNWVSTLSGQIKIIVSQDACVQTNNTTVSIRTELVAVGNTLDNQNDFGINTWVGHVYNWPSSLGAIPGGFPSPAAPPTTLTFSSSNYVGYYNIATETFGEGFGGSGACFPVRSNGTIQTNILTETFAVRYKMTSTRPAGCYILTFRGDDGIRLYNDGALVFDRWVIQAPTNYSNILIYLDGSADLVLDYYENGGRNVVEFSLTPFDASTNSITAPAYPTVCSGVTPFYLDGSSYIYNGTTVNPTVAFQWQSSSDNITFTNIAGATTEDYTPAAITTTSTIVTYYRRIVSAVSSIGSCDNPSNSVAITTTGVASPPPAAVAIAGSGATCNSFIANWSTYAGATAYLLEVATTNTFTVASMVAGYNPRNVGNVTTFTVTGLTATTYYYRVRAVSSCGISNASNVITYNTLVVPAPRATAATSIICNQFTANWNVALNATSYVIDVATNNGFGAATIIAGYSSANVGNVTSVTITGTFTYPIYYRVRGVGSCGTTANSNVVTVNNITATWNGTTWTNGPPALAKTAVINGNYDMTTQSSFDACSVRVNSPAIVTVTAGQYMNIQNNLTVATGATVNILDDGSLVQISNTGVNTGNINVQRNADVKLSDYVYWSSPVNSFSVNNIAPSATLRYRWAPTALNANGGEGNWLVASGNMNIGEGYIVRTPNITPYNNTTANILTANFTGIPNNGIYNVTVYRGNDYTTPGTQGIARTAIDDNWNLLGNPYPSAIGVNEFLNANSSAIEGFVKVWTHGQLPTSSVSHFYQYHTYNYFASDFLTVNSTGATSGPGDYKIASGQGFMVQMLAGPAGSATVTFNNTMRSSSFANNQFYRTDNGKNVNSNENSRIWLNLISNSQTNRILVGYIEGATNNRDHFYDAISDNKNSENFYSVLNNEPMTIQGKSLPFVDSDSVPLGIKIATNGNYKIGISNVDGLFSNVSQNIYLEDTWQNISHDLRQSAYSFTSEAGKFDNRFVLRYISQSLGNDDFQTIQNSVSIYALNNEISIDSKLKNIKEYEIYDVLGRVLTTKTGLNSNQTINNSIAKNNQTLIVKITLEDNEILVKKIIF